MTLSFPASAPPKSIGISAAARIVAAPDVMARLVGEETVILNLETEQYLGLDSIGTRFWSVLVESPNIEAAFAALLAEFEVEPERLRSDLEEFLARLAENGLIEIVAVEPIAQASAASVTGASKE